MKCQFHPTLPAENHCQYCEKHFCEQCSDAIHIGREVSVSAACFICGGELEALSKGSQIEPFWSRLGAIYKYPLAIQSVAAIVIIALLSTMLGSFGLFAIVPVVALNLYSFACLRNTAQGNNDAPGVESSFEGSIAPVIYVAISMLLAILLATFAFAQLGDGMGILISFFLVLVMPAVIIVIAIEERLLPALNVGSLIGIIKATGVSYFVMVLFIMVMMFSTEVLGQMFASTNFNSLSVFLTSVIGNYYNVVIFHILGYLVYQNHTELGYPVSSSVGVKKGRARNPKQRESMHLEVLIKAGKFDAARDLARSQLKGDSSLWEWTRAFKLFCAAKPADDVEKYFYRYVQKLRDLGELEKIADAYLGLLRAVPSFVVKDDESKLEIAGALQLIGKPTQSITLIRKLPDQSDDDSIIGRSLELLASGFAGLQGSEEHAEHFKTMHALHVARNRR